MEKYIWDFLKAEGLNNYGVAGLMGNLYAESGLNPTNLEDIYNTKLGYTDEGYTKAVDNGLYTNFINDCAGYGLAQWTYHTRKRGLYTMAKNLNTSIGNIDTQLKFLISELKNNYTNSVYKVLLNAESLQEASDAVLYKFENPANASSQSAVRLKYSQQFYNKYVKGVDSMINTYSRNSKEYLSNNFQAYEFDCGCGCSTTKIDDKLVDYLQKIRDHFGKPITITSAYRCPTHNAREGGASKSRHVTGEAADFRVEGIAPREVAKYAETLGIKGIGLYEAPHNFVHIDTRSEKSFWYGHQQAYRSTFGGGTSIVATNTNTNPIATLTYGSNGPEVKALQEKLLKLGYDLGRYGADGDYGAATRNAVCQFQRKEDLSPDGVAGPLTLAAIDAVIEKLDEKNDSYRVKVTASGLNVRSGPSSNYRIVGIVYKNTIHNVDKIEGDWGHISNPDGWINLSYVKEA